MIDQGTDDWREERSGCLTASCFGLLRWDAGEFFKSGPRKGLPKPPPKSRMDYIDQIVAEIITGQPKEAVRAKAMDYGHEMEPEALAAYEALQGRMAEQSGFLRHPDYEFIGASPDFLVDEEGGGEIKCPMSIVVHATTLREGLPDEHIEQIQGGLFVTGRHWWDFVSFNPKFPPGLDLYVERVERDEEAISQIKADCLLAWEEVQMIVRELRSRQ